jgi:SpoVK/Ycf46/Vps4 family AAA+-type ATPase
MADRKPKRMKNRPKRFVNEISIGKPDKKKRKRKLQITICMRLK